MDNYSGPAQRHIDYREYQSPGRLDDANVPTGRRATRRTAWALLAAVALVVVGLWFAAH